MTCRRCGADISHRPAQARFCGNECRATHYYETNAELLRADRLRRYYRNRDRELARQRAYDTRRSQP